MTPTATTTSSATARRPVTPPWTARTAPTPVASDDVTCTDDSCDEVNDVIVNATNDANCDNNLFCDGAETCHATLDCQDGADAGGE